MMRLFVVAFFVLGTACIVRAQDSPPVSTEANQNAAADFARTSAANPGALVFPGVSSAAPPAFGSVSPSLREPAWSFSEPGTGTLTTSGTTPAAGDPPPAAPDWFGARDETRWQLGVGFAIVGLRTPFFRATALGANTSISYLVSNWLALEAAFTGGFAPEILQQEHIKFLGFGAGPRITLRQKRWEPFAHLLLGGAHVIPEATSGSQSGFEVQAGGGTDYRFNPRLSARVEADWLHTNLYGQSENSVQGVIGLVLHF